MIKNLEKWLDRGNFEYFKNVAIGGKFPEIVAIKRDRLVAFEFKNHVSEISTAIGQCLFYLSNANKVYIVLPDEERNLISDSVTKILRDNGIGLILVDGRVKIILEAKNFPRENAGFIREIMQRGTPEKKIGEELDIKKKIVETLKVHPEGLKFTEIAKYTDISRFTISKYVFVLSAEGVIDQKKVGTSKLCFLR